MSNYVPEDKNKVDFFTLLATQFCEIVFLQQNLDALPAICRQDIILSSNFSSRIRSGFVDLNKFCLKYLTISSPIDRIRYERIETTLTQEGGVVLLRIALSDDMTFHLVFDIAKGVNESGEEVFLLSKIHIFHENSLHTTTCSTPVKTVPSNCTHTDTGNVFSQHGGTCGIIVCQAKTDYPLSYVDDRMATYLGYDSANELIALGNGVDLIHPDDLKVKALDLAGQLQIANDFAIEIRLRKKDNSYTWVGAVGAFSTNEENLPVVSILCVDIQKKQEGIDNFFKFMQTLSGGFAVYKVNEKIVTAVYYSPCLCEFLGLESITEERIITGITDCQGIIYEEDFPLLHTAFCESFEMEQDASADFRVKPKEGAHKWLNASSKFYKNALGESLLYVVYMDITEHKQALHKLQKIYDNIQGSILSCSYEDHWFIREANDYFYKEIGYSRAELQDEFNNDFFALVCDVDRDSLRANIADQLKAARQFSVQICLRSKYGKWIYAIMTGEITDQIGNKSLDFLLVNISEIKEKQEMLNNVSKEIRQLYNNIPGAIMRCTANTDGSIEFANDGFYKLIKYSKEEFEERHESKVINLIYAPDLPVVEEVFSRQSEHGDVLSFECRVRPKDGNQIWLSVDATVIVDNDGNKSLYCICTDTTMHHKMMSAMTLMKEKLETVVRHTGVRYWDYYPTTKQICIHDKLSKNGEARFIENFAESLIEQGLINDVSIDDFRALHTKVDNGERFAEAVILASDTSESEETWRKIKYTTIYDSKGAPSLALCVSENVNEYKEIERRLGIAAAQTGVDIWTYNLDTKSITQEEGVATIGVRESAVENVPESIIASGIIHEDDVEKYRDLYRRLEAGELQASCELRAQSRTGLGYSWTRVFYTMLPKKNSVSRLALGSAIDISEHKMAEIHYNDEIQLWNMGVKDALFACIVNLSSNTVVSSSVDKTLCIDVKQGDARTLWDSIYAQILGTTGREAFAKLCGADKLLHGFAKGTRSYAFDLQIAIANSDNLWVSLAIKMIKDPLTGDIIAFMIMNDITETKISQNFLKDLMKHQFDFILRLNFMSDTYQLFSSPEIKEAMVLPNSKGIYSQDVQHILDHIILEEDMPLMKKEGGIDRILDRSAAEGDYDIFFRAKRNGTENRFKRIHVFLRDDVTNSICMGCVDITDMHVQEQHRLDALREALSVARQASQSKSTFLASMSHDIRTPMNAIIGMTNLAIEDQTNTELVAESLGVIKSSSEHLLALLNDILEMSRLESGKVIFSKESFSIRYECEQVYNFFKGIVIQKNQKLHFECGSIENDQVISDLTRFNRVLTNLLGNAVKFTPEGGTITMRLEEVPTLTEKTSLFRVVVTDTGIGIAKENLSAIFEAFQREEKQSVRKIEGTGLGLAIVKALVENQGGAITVDSDTGKGAIFTVEIPMIIDEEVSKKALHKLERMQLTDINLHTKNILLIEDHPVNILVATKMLEKMGARVVSAKNGQEGAEVFKASAVGSFSFIFMDLQMPIMNGYEATEAIRSSDHEEATSIPIIAMTANAFAEDIRKCKEVGMNCHVAKPITAESISNCLMQLRII